MGGSVEMGHVHVEACKALSELVKRFDRAISGPRGALEQEGCKGSPAPPLDPVRAKVHFEMMLTNAMEPFVSFSLAMARPS